MTNKVLNDVKAINERLAVYERQGLTDSAVYQSIIERIKLEKLPTTKSKTGTIRISRAKTDLSDITEESLQGVKNIGGLKQERAKVKAKGFKTKSEQDERIKNYGKLKKWAEDHLHELYEDAKMGLQEAINLQYAFDSGLRNLDYDTIWAMIAKYEEARKKMWDVFEKSKYWRNEFNET